MYLVSHFLLRWFLGLKNVLNTIPAFGFFLIQTCRWNLQCRPLFRMSQGAQVSGLPFFEKGLIAPLWEGFHPDMLSE